MRYSSHPRLGFGLAGGIGGAMLVKDQDGNVIYLDDEYLKERGRK